MSPLAGGRRSLRSPLSGILSNFVHVKPIPSSPNTSIARRHHILLPLIPKDATDVKDCHEDSTPRLPQANPCLDSTAQVSHSAPRYRKIATRSYKLRATRHNEINGIDTTTQPQPQPQDGTGNMPGRLRGDVSQSDERLTTTKWTKGSTRSPLRHHSLPQEHRLAIYDSIRDQCEELGTSPDRSLYSREFQTRQRSLYPVTLIHPEWAHNMKTLITNKRRGTPEAEIWEMLHTEDPQAVSTWIKQALNSPSPSAGPHTRWLQLSRSEAARQWPSMVLWLLLNSPKEALDFLEVTTGCYSPAYSMVSDCFIYLELFHLAEFESSPTLKDRYLSSLRHCLRPSLLPYLSVAGQRGFRLYLKYCTPRIVRMTFKRIIESGKFVPVDTLLYFTDLFTKHGNTAESLYTLRLATTRFTSPGLLKSRKFTSRCCNLLKLDRCSRKDDGGLAFEILPQILGMGVQPNLSIFNVVVSNASKNDDVDTALAMVRLMESQGITPDSYTYLSILHNAVRLMDHEKVDYILHKITKVDLLSKQPHIVSKTLHAMLMFPNNSGLGQKVATAESFEAMLEVYKRAHKIQPLIDLGLISDDQSDKHLSITKSPPSNPSLGLMISSYLRMQKDLSRVWQTFKRFQELVTSGHPSIAPLVRTDYVFNAFLMALRFDSQMIPQCVMVVDSMLQPLPETALQTSQSGRPLPLPQAQPSKRTWTILLNILISHNQIEAAEKLRQMMKERGIEFNDVAWNILIRGYASNQMVEAAAKALKEMESQYWTPDGHTVKALGLIENQELLRTLLDHLDTSEPEPEEGKLATPES
ncbi:hypothetical protein FQN49_004446 [Arthroderma sp. PD_2]|nr:hypothetical protein FQN49_004446 [Arthroderma sp. PD_2]